MFVGTTDTFAKYLAVNNPINNIIIVETINPINNA